ncbi:MAG: cobaltochelatase subunit CobN [Rhizomicrobium sp.]
MHLLATQAGTIDDGSEAVDLGQAPGDIVLLTAADTELSCLAQARASLPPEAPSLRLANFLRLQHPLSVDLYVEQVVANAKLVVIRLLGGSGYWRYGLAEVEAACRANAIPFIIVPGDDKPDPELRRASTVTDEQFQTIWSYLAFGGIGNAGQFLRYAAELIGREPDPDIRAPRLVPNAGLYWPGLSDPTLEEIQAHWPEHGPVAPILFYRALQQSGALAPVDALIAALAAKGMSPLPIYVQSLKDPLSVSVVHELLARTAPDVILNCTSFATSIPGEDRTPSVLEAADCPVLQVVFASTSAERWHESARGLPARDVAMNVALPEVDGRILSRAVAFKAEASFDALTQCPIVTHDPVPDRIAFVAAQAEAWCRLRKARPEDRRVAIVLANYPNRDGRLGNGVGLDTPASAIGVLKSLRAAGYAVGALPADAQALMNLVAQGPTNALQGRERRAGGVAYPLADYERFFATLPQSVRDAVTTRWGAPQDDPFIAAADGDLDFRLSIMLFGSVALAVQPARGYNIDPLGSYHDPALVPPHNYLAFYAWLRRDFDAHAVVHMGKHGNLEWLPGKSVALSRDCFPEVALGPLPHLYPFIVNDPGEGTQAKRRASAVIIDHLTPPLTRAESYGPLRDLEVLVDEYYEAASLDARRLPNLKRRILDLAVTSGLDKDCGITDPTDEDLSIAALDNYLCELKELQIRDGLHIFGEAPRDRQLTDLLVALVRVRRGSEKGRDASILQALASDLALGAFDPLACKMGEPWTGAKPTALTTVSDDTWRTNGDTVERLERMAQQFVGGLEPPKSWAATRAVLAYVEAELRPDLLSCGANELRALERGLGGRFVAPGPSGAPTRGRPDVLPTGRNFYSLDPRAVPTQTAWQLGWQSAQLLVEDYRQRHGEFPLAMAISAWGTSNMRTGGDDIAQALALIGVRPSWDSTAGRVTGFEVLPPAKLGRPRVDVTFRISGFFRDAFPSQIDLFDSAVRAVMALDESDEDNPLALRFREDAARLRAAGLAESDAARRAGARIFGSKPGAYGAGLQAMIDERLWKTKGDLAEAYLSWGGYSYGSASDGEADHTLLRERLTRIDAVVQNQDNREHDLLDSDDYYQFEGGIANAVAHLKGHEPTIYHNDHSRPDTPRVRTLEDELARIVRGRAANPKWIAGVMRHGYKGAFEIAATVDYLFAFSATTNAVRDHHFDLLFAAYVDDTSVEAFMRENNPAALRELAERFLEALDRGLWKPRRNTIREHLERLIAGARS